jgi:cobyrinic acid a,c-diamide synthase
VQPFKVGPDFIDPGLHARVAGCESRNLDGWMIDHPDNRRVFQKLLHNADAAVVEGVMGLFDGYDGLSEAGSSAQMAKLLSIPVVLVVDARSMARSAAALVYGFSHFDPDLKFAGVLFNRIGGPGHLAYLKEALCSTMPDLPVLGGLPREDSLSLPERHLGLVTADELILDEEWQQRLIRFIEDHVDIDRLLSVSRCDPAVEEQADPKHAVQAASATVAVARDSAFCFYYPENLDLLRSSGADIRFFSPLAGETFPDDADGLYLGGGYPELFAGTISGNGVFMQSLRRAASTGMPIYAECGGLMTLGRYIVTLEGDSVEMAGLLPFGTRMLSRRKALGYTEVLLREPCLLGEPGLILKGHEFHYSEIVELPGQPAVACAYELRKRKHEAVRLEGYMTGSVLASYIHLHWGSTPSAPAAFVRRCVEYRGNRA